MERHRARPHRVAGGGSAERADRVLVVSLHGRLGFAVLALGGFSLWLRYRKPASC